MKKFILFTSLFLAGLFDLNALQTSFKNTVQIFRPSVVDFREDGIQGCFKDGVLLRVRPQAEQTADGVTWLAVGTPDGRAGWASSEFLER